MVRVLATGRAEMGGLVAVTFTEKAAGELKLRLRQELENERSRATLPAEERAALEAALRSLEEAQISTIHGFCADLLKEYPVEAGVDPLFVVLTEDQARRRYDEAFASWFQAALKEMPEGVRRSLRRSTRTAAGSADADGPVDRLRAAGWQLTEWRDFPASWTRPEFERTAEIDRLTTCVRTFAAITREAASLRDPLYLDTAPARRASDELPMLIDAGDPDGAEALLIDLSRDRDFRRARKGYGPNFAKGLTRAVTHEALQELVLQLDIFKRDADADLAALLRDELRGSLDLYEDLKTRRGELDFFDLLHRARTLVHQHEGVRAQLQARCARIFVDEFQDTDPLQAELLLLLTADDPHERNWRAVRPVPGKLFIVGDPKQSIYRFRRADVQVYHDVCRQLLAHGARHLTLTTSFRSAPNLQRAVNAGFGEVMIKDADTLQAGYIPLSPSREQAGGQPSVVALPVPRPYGRRNISAMAIEQSLPDAVGAFIGWLVHESGWKVTTRQAPDTPEPVKPGHVCILFRRFVSFGTDVTRAYVDALEARGVRHLLVGGRAFHDREEIETLRAALAAIEWPDDELSVFATLRGALFAIGDEELLEYRHRYGRAFHPFRVPADLPAHLSSIGQTLTTLARLHTQRNRRPVAETVMRLLDDTRAHVGFALRRSGEQVLANVLHVAELARQYERNDGLSFRGFVETLREAAERGDATEAPIVEDGSDGVRLMTVHKAKGLEFPVVVLADITAKLAQLEASRSIDGLQRPLRPADRRVVAQGSARPAGRGARPGSGRRRAPGLCGRDPRPRSAGGAGRRRRAVRGWVGEPAEPCRVSSAGASPHGRSGRRLPGFQARLGDRAAGRRHRVRRHGQPRPASDGRRGCRPRGRVVGSRGAASRCRGAVRVAARGVDREGRPAAGDRRGHAAPRGLAYRPAGRARERAHPLGGGEHDDGVDGGGRRRCRQVLPAVRRGARSGGRDDGGGSRTSGRRALRHAGPRGVGHGAARGRRRRT